MNQTPGGDPRRVRLAFADRLALPGLLVLAGSLRLVLVPDGGTWDSDQGRDLLTLRSMAEDGVLPLLGPVTSVGAVHHGAAYYYLLAPFAVLGRLDPAVVALAFVAAGVATVGLVWWLARSIGGAVAGLIAGLLVAVSPSAIAASVTIWNPNLVAPATALALAAAWRAWTSRRPGWWIVGIGAVGLAAQLHVISSILVAPVGALLVADLRRSTAPERRRLARATVGGLAVAGALFLPLIAHELGTGFDQLRAVLDFLRGERGPATLDVATRLVVASYRMASWPIVGLAIDTPVVASLVSGLFVGVALWCWRRNKGTARTGSRWLISTILWSAAVLAVVAPDLAMIVRGLPNDQYHAATDPIIPVLLGLGIAGLLPEGALTGASRAGGQLAPRGLLAVAIVAALVIVEVSCFPPLRDPDGGWPAARSAAERVARTTGDRDLLVVGLPRFKPTDGLVFPLSHLGLPVVDEAAAAGALVVVCDRLFEPSLGAACGGDAERGVEREQPRFGHLADRFDLSGRTSISVYLPVAGAGLRGRGGIGGLSRDALGYGETWRRGATALSGRASS
jgi:hypothetical protein